MNNWQFYALSSAFFAGLTAILGKLGVEGVNSNFATFIRTIVILAVLISLLTLRKEWQSASQVSARSFMFLTLSGVATGCSWICYYRALQLGPASRVAPVDKLSVAFAMILAFLFLKEEADWQTLTGGALIIGGSVMMILGR